MTRRPSVVVLDYGSGNLRSAARALEAAGADVEVTDERPAAMGADGLVIPGVGAFAACMTALTAVAGESLIDSRLARGRAVLGICVGMQVLFEAGDEHGEVTEGFAQWPGIVTRLPADVLPHMGWNTVYAPSTSALFDGVGDQRFYFVHSYAVTDWRLPPTDTGTNALVTWTDYGAPFVAAVENGPLTATQFHPEKSGPAGLRLLQNWVDSIRGQAA